MCCPEPDDVQYELSLYGCGQLIELNDLSGVRYDNVIDSQSANGGVLV